MTATRSGQNRGGQPPAGQSTSAIDTRADDQVGSAMHMPNEDEVRSVMRMPTDDQVRAALAQVLGLDGRASCFELTRTPCEQQSTFPLELLEVRFAAAGIRPADLVGQRCPDPLEMRLAFKRLARSCLEEAPQRSRPSLLFDAAREPAVYERLLPLAPKGPPRYFGSFAVGPSDERWLFVEWVQGRELHQIGELSTWAHVAGWLGDMHRSLAAGVEDHLRTAGLLRHDEAHCRRWPLRARELAGAIEADSDRRRRLLSILRRYDTVLQALMQMPTTVIHGDFYASNVLIAEDCGRLRVAPIDWEMAAAGPGLIDLAALISGNWSEHARQIMIAAYQQSAGGRELTPRQLDFARLHHAMQRLGWAPRGWAPPPSQRHDWLGEVIEIADRLGL